MILAELKNKVLGGQMLGKPELLSLVECDLQELTSAADEVREFFCGKHFDTCAIEPGKSGRCGEDCKFCAQSARYKTGAQVFPLQVQEKFVTAAERCAQKGISRFSVVTSGGTLGKEEIQVLCASYKEISERFGIKLCSSNGALDLDDLARLKASGVSRYHCNLETSRKFFPNICTTHTYDSKIATIKLAKEAGLEICSGGIIGLGESVEDRIDLALELRNLGVSSVPINVLNPIKGTPLGERQILGYDEIARTVAIFRLALPQAEIRLAGGRVNMKDLGRGLFRCGVNAVITGDLLTTHGALVDEDLEAIRRVS